MAAHRRREAEEASESEGRRTTRQDVQLHSAGVSDYNKFSCGVRMAKSATAADCAQLTGGASALRDAEWATQTCTLGFPVQGIWPPCADGTDVNAACRSSRGDLIATGDDFGKVKLFRYPCIVPQADCKPYSGHSSHVTNIGFTYDDGLVLSAGGEDRAVFQWRVVAE